MMRRDAGEILKTARRRLAGIVSLVVLVAINAQGCPMCYQNAAASGPRTIHALNTGILILMFPPVLITMGIFYLGYKKRNTFHDSD
jgi:hypothetical protein